VGRSRPRSSPEHRSTGGMSAAAVPTPAPYIAGFTIDPENLMLEIRRRASWTLNEPKHRDRRDQPDLAPQAGGVWRSVAKRAMRRGGAWLTAPVLLSAAVEVVSAQAPDPGSYSRAQFAVQQSLGNLVAMRDGVHLSVDTYR